MPPQMETNAIHDALPPTRTRRALANVNVSQDTIAGSTTGRTRSKRSPKAQDRSTSKVVSSSGTPATHRLTPTPDFNSVDGGEQAMTTVRDRVSAMQETFGAQLEFLITEFTKLEEQLLQVPDAGSNSEPRAEDVQLTRLRYFVAHVRRTVERMEQAKTGQHRYTLEQLDMLDEHITRRLLPVKDKLVAQLGQRPRAHESSGLFDSYRLLTTGDASAVSEGWISSDGSTTDSSVADNEVSNAPSMAQPSSSLSFAELSELCGDRVGDDYAGSYLVGQDCDDVDDSAIGLDLYDMGHGKDFLFSRDNARADSVSTMSAVTDGELSDDSLSVDDTSLAKSAIDQEMGELSKLFAPDDAFLPISLLDPEDKKTETTEAKEAIAIVPTLQEDKRNDDHVEQVKQDATPIGPILEPKTELSSTPVVSPAVIEVPPQQRVINTSASTSMIHPVKKEENCACSGFAVPCKRSVDLLVQPAQCTKVEGSTVPSAPVGPSPPPHSFRQRKRQRSSLAPILSAPRNVKYECSLCKESYQCSISSNPWWSLLKQECPKCHRVQIPRVDAASAAVCVDSIHAVCAEEGEGGDSDGYGSDSCSETDDDDDQGPEALAVFDTEAVAGDVSPGCTDSRLSTSQASRLLVLMAHARNCPGVHANPRHAEACQSTKFLMLHIRDCSGYGPTSEPCPHNWCRPCKSLLSHLVHCTIPGTCRICSPAELSSSFHMLRELNGAQAREATASMAAATTMKTEDGL